MKTHQRPPCSQWNPDGQNRLGHHFGVVRPQAAYCVDRKGAGYDFEANSDQRLPLKS
jgi:hypothetical protein